MKKANKNKLKFKFVIFD